MGILRRRDPGISGEVSEALIAEEVVPVIVVVTVVLLLCISVEQQLSHTSYCIALYSLGLRFILFK